VILFSHGLGGSREGSPFLGQHWARRGYVCVFLQHPGSDASVWKDAKSLERMAALRGAADAKNFMLRVQDVPAVLDQLEVWNKEPKHWLAGRMDLAHVGMSGHSFGAVTTQAVSGQSTARGRLSLTDKRIIAALPMSPSLPKAADAKETFGSVKIPWLLMTGTNDTSPIGDQTVESRLAVFPALPAGDKYELVLNKAEHSVFTERALPGDKAERNPNHHRAILAISTAFWDAYLRDDKTAREWLTGDGPKKVLEKEDRWSKK
jgi:predicted dienelactone hydrolase